MTRNVNSAASQAAKPLPNYGRAAAYGLAAAVFGGAVWAAFQAFSGAYIIFLTVAAGWLCGTSVKRGMGTVTRGGILLSLFYTALTVLLAEYFYFARLYVNGAGRFSPGGVLNLLVGYYSEDTLRLAIMLVFTLTGMVIALIYSR